MLEERQRPLLQSLKHFEIILYSFRYININNLEFRKNIGREFIFCKGQDRIDLFEISSSLNLNCT